MIQMVKNTVIGRKLSGIICKGEECQKVDLPPKSIIVCNYSDYEYLRIPEGYKIWVYNDATEKGIEWHWCDKFNRVYDSMRNLLMSIEEESTKFVAVSSIVHELKPYIGGITVYGDRTQNPRIEGFSHTFRGMTRQIDFFDNELVS